ncbi:MAG: hypothetical protein AB2A00_24335 [Myxococcota bacterium]
MRVTFWAGSLLFSAAVGMGCGTTGDGDGTTSSSGGASCDANASSYAPFSAANFTTEQAQVAAYGRISALRKTATFAKSDFTALKTDYDTHFASAVQGLTGVPSWENANVGTEIHTLINNAINRGLDTNDTTDIAELGQIIEKSLIRYLYLATYSRVMTTSGDAQANWDKVFGIYGRSEDGATSAGISGSVKGRDDNYSLTNNDKVFSALIKGRCAIVDGDNAALTAARTEITTAMDESMAYSGARYFKKISEGGATRVDLAEGGTYWYAVERRMQAADAATIRAWVDALMPGGAREDELPDVDGASTALGLMRSNFSLPAL